MIKHKKQSQNSSAKGSIRIIAGKHRGRKLPVVLADGLRPTTDRVKETVFNWLMPYVQDSRCLDCFAGAGSLGFEALSRGAEQVTFVELNKNAASQLTKNKLLLKADNTEVINQDILAFLTNAPQQFDLVFLDPPFRKQFIVEIEQRLNSGWLLDGAIIYVEAETELSQQHLPTSWQLLKEKIAGQVAYRLYQYNENIDEYDKN